MAHITDKLHEDHQKVEQLFKKLLDTSDGAEKTRRDLCQKLKEELLAHAEFEEEVFYPTVRERDGVDKQVEHSIEEHQEVKTMLQEIEAMDTTSPEFLDKITELQAAVQEHVDEEESELFPAARKVIEKQEGEEMSRQHDEMVRQHSQAPR